MKPGQFVLLVDRGTLCLIGDHLGNVVEMTSAKVDEIDSALFFTAPIKKEAYPALPFQEYKTSDGVRVDAAFVKDDPAGRFWYRTHPR